MSFCIVSFSSTIEVVLPLCFLGVIAKDASTGPAADYEPFGLLLGYRQNYAVAWLI
jgi:hypothetical protein